MSRALALTVVLAACLAADAVITGSGAGGTFYKVLPGYHVASCQSGDCQSYPIRRFGDVVACAKGCTEHPRCRCAIFRPKDGYCSFKNYRCIDPRIGLKTDASNTHQAINVARPAPTVTPKPSPVVPKPSPSPVAAKPGPSPANNPGPATGPSPIGRDSGGAYIQEGGLMKATMTIFQGFGIPYGGCGVPMADMVDDNGKMLPYVALNQFTGNSEGIGMFENGANCGRWLKITIGKPCGGSNAGENIPACLANYDSGESDGKDGKVIYGYVADKCADTNAWCGGSDPHHVDMGKENMIREGLDENWKNNRIEWSFISSTPPGWVQTKMQYKWCANSKKDWLCVIATRVNNGVSKIQVMMKDGSWQDGWQVYVLGQQWSLPGSNEIGEFDGKYRIRAIDHDGNPYPEVLATPPNGSENVEPIE